MTGVATSTGLPGDLAPGRTGAVLTSEQRETKTAATADVARRPRRSPGGPGRGPVRLAWLLGCLQLAILLLEAHVIVARAELTMDYQIFARAYAAIGHGHLSPVVYLPSTLEDTPYLANHFELLTWPLALLGVGLLHLPVHVVLLDLLQAVPTALVTPLVALGAAQVADRRRIVGLDRWLLVTTPALLSFCDVWIYRADSFDFHYQALQGALLVGALVALERGNRRIGWALVGALALSGDTAGLLIAIVGGLLLWRRQWRPGVTMLAVAAAVVVVPSLLHDDLGSQSAFVAYAALGGVHSAHLLPVALGLVRHPGAVLRTLRRRDLDIWGLVAGSGLVGIVSPVGLLGAVTVGLPAWIGGPAFAYPGDFQTLPLVDVMLLGTGGVLGLALGHRRRHPPRPTRRRIAAEWAGRPLAIGSVALAAGWTAVFGPGLASGLTHVSTPTVARSLAEVTAGIPTDAEVLTPNASLGTVGLAGARVYDLACRSRTISFPLFGRPVDLVVDPWRGIQACGVSGLAGFASDLASRPGARLRTLPGGVLWVSWQPPAEARSLRLRSDVRVLAPILAAAPDTASRLDREIPGGAVVPPARGGFAREGLVSWIPANTEGEAVVRLDASGPVEVQVFDDRTGRLVSLLRPPATLGWQTIVVPFRAPRFELPSGFSDGVGLWRTTLLPPPRVDPMEVRVWSPPTAGADVAVSSAWIGPARAAPDA